jgi:uncharacterized protein YodC (DUF2158 family)
MTKKTILSIVLSLAVLVGGLYFLQSLQTENQTIENNENNSEEISEEKDDVVESGGKKMAFSQFAKQKGSYKCEVDQYIDAGYSQKTTGTVFLNDGKIRGDFDISVQGMNLKASLIVKDDFNYAWTSMSPVGRKVKIDTETEVKDANNVVDHVGSYAWNDELIGDYNCESWSVDNSVFELPAGVQFQEV